MPEIPSGPFPLGGEEERFEVHQEVGERSLGEVWIRHSLDDCTLPTSLDLEDTPALASKLPMEKALKAPL